MGSYCWQHLFPNLYGAGSSTLHCSSKATTFDLWNSKATFRSPWKCTWPISSWDSTTPRLSELPLLLWTKRVPHKIVRHPEQPDLGIGSKVEGWLVLETCVPTCLHQGGQVGQEEQAIQFRDPGLPSIVWDLLSRLVHPSLLSWCQIFACELWSAVYNSARTDVDIYQI